MELRTIRQRARQQTSHLLMVRPVRFGFNEQTAANNAFQQQDSSADPEEVQAKALAEFDLFVAQLREVGITVTVFEDSPVPHTPDSIFPNNWISFHRNGKIIVYPIFAPNRRLERRWDIVEHFATLYPEPPEVIDLSVHEAEERFLEGTGSMIMDRIRQKVYACRSARTDEGLFEDFCQRLDVEGVLFDAVDRAGTPIYHTNVMMALGEQFGVICLEAIRDDAQRERVVRELAGDGYEIVALTLEQVEAFAGNMLQLYNHQGEPYLVMSKRAFESLTEAQLHQMRQHTRLLVIPLDVIESFGGGSVRCMMAEVFLDFATEEAELELDEPQELASEREAGEMAPQP